MMYHQRLANSKEADQIAPLWREFLQQRAKHDPSMVLKPDFDYVTYVQRKLNSPSIFGFLLQWGESQEIVGFLFVYVQDELALIDGDFFDDSPFQPKRIGGALGMYIQEKHRQPEGISLLIEAALRKAEELKVSDIDLLISAEQTGIHTILARKFGFQKAAVQYTKHFEVESSELPNLPQKVADYPSFSLPAPQPIPLKDPQTQQPIFNPQGKPVFLYPLKNAQGELLKSRSGLPIFATPLRDPSTQDWVFDAQGNLVVCPPILDELGKVKEKNGIPVFQTPLYQQVEGKLGLKQDEQGNYLFDEY
ncbi:MAG: GNAT family N-acetyltransferase [Microcystaceae cyanobacterium]